MLNKYIKSIGTQTVHEVREPFVPYKQQAFPYEPLDEFPDEL